MARKYYGTFKSFNNTTWKVEIYDAPSGSTTGGTELKLAGDGFALDRDGEGSKYYDNRIKSSRITAQWVIPNSTVLNDFIGIQTEAENYWTMVVWRGSDLFFPFAGKHAHRRDAGGCATLGFVPHARR